jgi:hypothetical protein
MILFADIRSPWRTYAGCSVIKASGPQSRLSRGEKEVGRTSEGSDLCANRAAIGGINWASGVNVIIDWCRRQPPQTFPP